MHASPVDTFKKGGQLSSTQLNDAVTGLRPHEAAAVQAFIEKAHPIGVVPKQLHSVAAPAAKDI